MSDEKRADMPEPADAELAACMAAVAAIMSDRGETIEPRAVTTTNWYATSLIEGVRAGRANHRPAGWSAWKTVLGLALALLVNQVPAKAKADSINDLTDVDHVPVIAHYRAGNSAPVSSDISASPVVAAVPQACLLDSMCQSLMQKNRVLMKVALCLGSRSVQVDVPDGAIVVSFSTTEKVAALPAHSRFNVTAASSSALAFSGKTNRDFGNISSDDDNSPVKNVAFLGGRAIPVRNSFNLPQSPGTPSQGGGYVVIPGGADPGDQLVGVNGRLYRGAIWLRPISDGSGGTAVQAINVVGLEDYLLSVLPSEMPSTWPQGALQAQAIAARSYAVANLGKHAREGYDLRATTDDQVYLGVSSEHLASNEAVAATSGVVLKYAGKPITAFFHSASGGYTEAPDQVWGRAVPYLKAVADFDDNSPHFSWIRKLSADEVEKAFADVGKLQSIVVTSRSPSNRVKTATITGSTGSKQISGDAIRLALKLPSSNFNIGYEENTYSFAGRGFGHGMGMSQYGARALAEQGYNAAQILAYYYKDVTVEYVSGNPGI
jgi:SpoIID/LytB domain protein